MNELSTKKMLKFLCVIFFGINVLSILLSFFRFSLVDEPFHKLLEYDSVGYMLPLYFIWPVFIFTTLLMILPLPFICKGNILAFKFFLCGTAVSVLLTLVSGVRVSIPIESFLGAMLYMSWGGILSIGLLDENIKKVFG